MANTTLPTTTARKPERIDLSDDKAWVTKRPRVPDSFAVIEVIVRFIGVSLALTVLALCTGLAIQYCVIYIAVIVNGCLCFVVDLVEIVPLLDASRNIRRLRNGAMCILEVPAIVSCIVSGFQAYSGVWRSGEDPVDAPLPPDSKWKGYILTAVVVVGIWRLFMIVFVCAEVSRSNRKERKARRRMLRQNDRSKSHGQMATTSV